MNSQRKLEPNISHQPPTMHPPAGPSSLTPRLAATATRLVHLDAVALADELPCQSTHPMLLLYLPPRRAAPPLYGRGRGWSLSSSSPSPSPCVVSCVRVPPAGLAIRCDKVRQA